eukprot:2171103-Rhodomonas_salina.5
MARWKVLYQAVGHSQQRWSTAAHSVCAHDLLLVDAAWCVTSNGGRCIRAMPSNSEVSSRKPITRRSPRYQR